MFTARYGLGLTLLTPTRLHGVLSQRTTVRILTTVETPRHKHTCTFPLIYYNIILPSTSRSSKRSISFRFPTRILHEFITFPMKAAMSHAVSTASLLYHSGTVQSNKRENKADISFFLYHKFIPYVCERRLTGPTL